MLKAKLQADQLAAMKSGDKKTVETLRFILAQIKNKEIDKRADLTEEEVVATLRKQVKEIQESIDAFVKGNRTDLVTEYEAQKKIAQHYLPAEMSDEALTAEVKKIIGTNSAIAAQNPKAIIGVVMKELRGKADPARIMTAINFNHEVC